MTRFFIFLLHQLRLCLQNFSFRGDDIKFISSLSASRNFFPSYFTLSFSKLKADEEENFRALSYESTPYAARRWWGRRRVDKLRTKSHNSRDVIFISNFSYYFHSSFFLLFTACRKQFISGKAHHRGIFNFSYHFVARPAPSPDVDENCFIVDEWKAAGEWLMKNVMRQSDMSFPFAGAHAREKKRSILFESLFLESFGLDNKLHNFKVLHSSLFHLIAVEQRKSMSLCFL